MSMKTSTALIAVLALALRAPASHAQSAAIPPLDSTLHWHLRGAGGGGAGAGGLSGTVCADGTRGGAAGFARLGGAYGSRLIISAQFDWWSSTRRRSTQNTELTLRSTNVVVQWFPSTDRRWFIAPGFGHGSTNVQTTVPLGESASSQGVSYQFGAGYEIPLALHFALTPYASYLATPSGSSANSRNQISGSVLQGGVALAWR